MFNMGNMMKQAQLMQQRLEKVQQEIAALEVQGEAGAGLVKITMTGAHEVKAVNIDKAALDDTDMLEDLLAAAYNDAHRRVEEASKAKMATVTGGMQLPPGFKLPF